MIDNLLLTGRCPVDAVRGDVEEHVQLAEVLGVPGCAVVAAVALTVGGAVLLDNLPDDLPVVTVQLRLRPLPGPESLHPEETKRLKVNRVCPSLEEGEDQAAVDGEEERFPHVSPVEESCLQLPAEPGVSAGDDVDPENSKDYLDIKARMDKYIGLASDWDRV